LTARPFPTKKNVELTREVVKHAHQSGVTVEGELGVLAGMEDRVAAMNSTYTDPVLACDFVKKTGVDCLAISYGTQHGAVKGANVKLRREIAVAASENLRFAGIDALLVSHGSSTVPRYIVDRINALGGAVKGANGIPVEELRAVIPWGIRKINVDTDIRLAVTRNFREYFHNHPEKKTSPSIGSVWQLMEKNPDKFDPRVYLPPVMDCMIMPVEITDADVLELRELIKSGVRAEVLECFKKFNIRYFFYNGGNDSMDTCNQIHKLAMKAGYELNVIGIPKTIDNDLAETDHSPGFPSAARYAALGSLELAMDAASLPIHVVVVELMGRNAGWITAASALFSGPMPCEHLVYLPERPLGKDRFLEDLEKAWSKGRGVLVTVSEGLKDQNGRAYGDTGVKDGFGHTIPGGTAQSLADIIMGNLNIKARAEKPGLLGRVSMAHCSGVDIKEACDVGAFAIKSAVQGKSGFMVGIEAARKPSYSSRLKLIDLEKVANVEKVFPEEWIHPDGNGVGAEFSGYCFPLIGTEAPEYANLR
jgi:6-phosphofructokinase 1